VVPGIDFVKINFGRKLSWQIVILKV
jgi:hypothetical protein